MPAFKNRLPPVDRNHWEWNLISLACFLLMMGWLERRSRLNAEITIAYVNYWYEDSKQLLHNDLPWASGWLSSRVLMGFTPKPQWISNHRPWMHISIIRVNTEHLHIHHQQTWPKIAQLKHWDESFQILEQLSYYKTKVSSAATWTSVLGFNHDSCWHWWSWTFGQDCQDLQACQQMYYLHFTQDLSSQ